MAKKTMFDEKMVMIGIKIPQSLKEFLDTTGLNTSQQVREGLMRIKKNSFHCDRCNAWTLNSCYCKWCEALGLQQKKLELVKDAQDYLTNKNDGEGCAKVAALINFYERNYVGEGDEKYE